jgi:hypothetical protein
MSIETPSTDLPEDLAQRLSLLGPPVGAYAVDRRRSLHYLLGAAVPLLVGIGLLLVCLLAIQHLRHGFPLKLVLIGGALIVTAIVVGIRNYRARGLQVLVYPEGLIRIHRGEAKAVLWEEVQEVWYTKAEGMAAKVTNGAVALTVVRENGDKLHFGDQLPHLDELALTLHRLTLPLLLERARERFDTTGRVVFGPVTVSRAGIGQADELLPWDEVETVALNEDTHKLAIRKKGKWLDWYETSLSEVPNFHVLRELISHARTLQQSPAEDRST